MDSPYSDPDVNDWLHGHEVVSIEPLDSHEYGMGIGHSVREAKGMV